MKALFVIQPGEGHLNPLLPIARELVREGHEVACAAAAKFCPLIESRGLRAFPAGLDWLESETEAVFPEIRRLSLSKLGGWYVSELFADVAVHHMVPDLLAICRSWQPDLLLRNDFEFATCIVSELTEIPQATIGASFLWSQRELQVALEEPLAFARSAFGLPPYPALDMLHPYLYLSYVPASWHASSLPVLHSFRPFEAVVGTGSELPEWSRRLAGRPTVYASLGTMNSRRPEFLTAIVEALRDEPLNLIVTVGRNQDPGCWGPQPDNVHIERYIPHQDLLPFCDLLVTNSSFFTILLSVLYSVPTVMMPLLGDEPAQAARFAQIGAGRALRPLEQQHPWLGADAPEFSIHTLRLTVREMLVTAAYRAQVLRLRDEILAQPPPAHAVSLLARMAEEQCRIESGTVEISR